MTTAREYPKSNWLFDSLRRQVNGELIDLILVSLRTGQEYDFPLYNGKPYRIVQPKPCVWQGRHRLTKSDWWAVSNARNTAICLCKTEWIAFLDDRSVLSPVWLECVRAAMEGNYIMAGSYEKRQNMVVENGAIVDFGILQAEDARVRSARGQIIPCPGEWLFGCNLAMPLEWLLNVNGYPESWCDGMSFEDCILGLVLQNNRYPMKFDPRAKMIEDRTPDALGEPMKRTAHERFPHDTTDKAHTVLNLARSAKRCDNPFNIRELLAKIHGGEPFPIPTEPTHDWFNKKPLSEFE